MKFMNMIKLLSVLLCIVMLFAACESSETEETTTVATTESETESVTETETETETETDEVYVKVDPELDNFIKFDYEEHWNHLSSAERMDDVVAEQGDLIVLRDATVDHMNVVTETFGVYNVKLGKVVFTTSHTYNNLNYSVFDWNDLEYPTDHDAILPESVVRVNLLNLDGSVYCIEVGYAKLTPVSEEVLEENPDAYAYEVEARYEYYDVEGTLLGQVNGIANNATVNYWTTNLEAVGLSIGNKSVILDRESGKLIREITAENEQVLGGFDYENEKYGYFLYGYESSALGSYTSYVEVYTKATGEINRYYYDGYVSHESLGVLRNGDVVIQVARYLPEEKGVGYDYIDDSTRYALDTFVVDVSREEMRKIELDYVIAVVAEKNLFTEQLFDEKNGVSFTESAWNIAVANPINDKKLESARIVIFNNDMEAVFEMAPIAPEHHITVDEYVDYNEWSLGIRVLGNGDLLLDLDTPATDALGNRITKAIVTRDGHVRSYLVGGCRVVGNYIVDSNGIYDYDMKLLHSFEESEQTLVATIGNKIIVSKTVEDWEWSQLGGVYVKTEHTEYYTLTSSGDYFYTTQVLEDEIIHAVRGDYLITVSRDTYNGQHKYTMYNADLADVLTTHGEMRISEFDGGYFVTSYINGITVCYTVK